LEHAAPDRDRHRVRAVIRLQLAYDILDVEVDCGFRNVQSAGDFFVLQTVLNEYIIAEVLGKTLGHVCRNVSIAGMN
jgi:hypothetical protein